MAGVAVGTALTFSAASLFLLFPLFAGVMAMGGLGFGLSAGAFVLSGILASAFNLVSAAFCVSGLSLHSRKISQARGEHVEQNARKLKSMCCGTRTGLCCRA
jgi:hypothetical protein